MSGLRISIAVPAAGVAAAAGLADDMLKAHTALVPLRRFVEAFPILATPYIIADIDPLLADTHAFEELRLLSQLHSRATTLNEDEIASLRYAAPRRCCGSSPHAAFHVLETSPTPSRVSAATAAPKAGGWAA